MLINKKIQIGVIGSTASGKYSAENVLIAEQIGTLIAESNNYLVFGAEKDQLSLSTIAALACRKKDGQTIAITYGINKNIWLPESADIIFPCGLERGGGREFILVTCCDVIIALCGGAGTLNEISIAYQLNIPVICLKNSGGWSSKLANSYLDSRRREFIFGEDNPPNAVELAIKQANRRYNR